MPFVFFFRPPSFFFIILSFVLEPVLIHDVGFYRPISLPLDHLLVVGSLPQLIHLNLFSLSCVINIRHISSHKMTTVGFEPQWYITQHLVFTTRPLARLLEAYRNLFTISFSLAYIIKFQPFLNHKMTSVELEPHLAHDTACCLTTRPLARCWKLTATYSP